MTANDSVSFAEYFKEHPDANLRLLSGDLGTGSNSSILMVKGQDALRNAIDESLKKHLQNGDIKAIYEKYVGKTSPEELILSIGAEFRSWNATSTSGQNHCRSC